MVFGCSLSAALLATACDSPAVRGPEVTTEEELRAPPQCALPEVAEQPLPPMPEPRHVNEPVATTLDVGDWNAACDVGAVGIHRLNRTELQRTLSELLRVPALEVFNFPVDDSSEGFDNLADVLAVSPLFVEKVSNVSADLIDEALAQTVAPQVQVFEAENLEAETGNPRESFYVMNGPGTLRMRPDLENAGTYLVRVRAWGEQAGADLPLMGILVDGDPLATFEVEAVADSPGVYETTLTLGPDNSVLGVSFANDYYFDSHPIESERDRNLVVDFVEVEGPLELVEAAEDSETRKAILSCRPETPNAAGEPMGVNACASEIIDRFAHLAWRRPATDHERVRLLRLLDNVYANGTPDGEEPFEFGIRLALRAILMSPNFLYRIEVTEGEDGVSVADANSPQLLSDHALASRLSYFLWSGPPDARLLELAQRRRLQDDAVLEAEVRRMLQDPRSRAFVDNFAGQWLQTRAVQESTPDPERYPAWSNILGRHASCETLNLFNHLLRTDAPVSELLTADYTFLTPSLADHYGLDVDASGTGYTQVSLEGTERRGVLTHASVLTVTSNPTRTSPVKRGKWVLEQLMCIPPPPPPPGVEGLPEDVDAETLREKLALHREDPVCASCHDMMDPIGLALEHFDAVGQWRDDDQGGTIETANTFFTGEPFEGHGEMIDLIVESESLERCATTKIMTYAMGRLATEEKDWCAIDAATYSAVQSGGSFSDIIAEVAKSAPFRMRRPAARDEDVELPEGEVDPNVPGTEGSEG